MKEKNELNVLLVEDNPGDARLTREAFFLEKGDCTLNIVDNGEKALAFLRKEGKYNNAILPKFI